MGRDKCWPRCPRFRRSLLRSPLLDKVARGAVDQALERAESLRFTMQGQIGPQAFSDPDVPIAGGEDPEILGAVEAAVSVSSEFGFRHDASGSERGKVVVEALWKGRPITLTMRFRRREESAQAKAEIYLSSKLTQPGDVSLVGGGEQIESLFYSRLREVTTERGLRIVADPAPDPELRN